MAARADIQPVEQLALVPAPPKLSDRQQAALDALKAAGYDGLHTDELGAIVHSFSLKHGAAMRCEWCGAAGQEVGKALRAKGLAQQRRRRLPGGDLVVVWTTAGKLERVEGMPPGMTDRIPF